MALGASERVRRLYTHREGGSSDIQLGTRNFTPDVDLVADDPTARGNHNTNQHAERCIVVVAKRGKSRRPRRPKTLWQRYSVRRLDRCCSRIPTRRRRRIPDGKTDELVATPSTRSVKSRPLLAVVTRPLPEWAWLRALTAVSRAILTNRMASTLPSASFGVADTVPARTPRAACSASRGSLFPSCRRSPLRGGLLTSMTV